MEDYFWLLIVVAWIVWAIISWFLELLSDARNYKELKPRLDRVEAREIALFNEREKAQKEYEQQNANIETVKLKARDEIELLAKQRSMGFPWLAEAYADYFALRDQKREDFLKNKKHPAFTTASVVKAIKIEKKVLEKEKRMFAYKITYYEKLFPWLKELIAENEDEEIPVRIEEDITTSEDETEDKVKNFLTQEEYRSLPTIERNQLALDRYLKNRHKSKWAIGRDYEMYVGYVFEQEGYSVEYRGIIDGYEDLGRDIIARKEGETLIVQCKYWAQYKDVHEKHVFQLFGTTMEYWIKHFAGSKSENSFERFTKVLSQNKLRPIFITSTTLSTKAKEMAQALNIEVRETVPIGEFPRIKCNINNGETGETKIYHLPIDQQYDRTIIGNRSGEFMAYTVKEAEEAGFRRAFRYRF